jgi:ATP-dependent helicase/nuclease subunit A
MSRRAPSAGPGHLALTASAGSGKTYQLTARMIGLMTLGASPERILAVTFTRKSAGDIFQRLITRLARACREPRELAGLNDSLPDWARKLDAAGASDLLRRLTDSMPRLAIGTLDSFFYRVARAFCFELGLPPGVEILEEGYAREHALEQALDRWLAPGDGENAANKLATWIEQASFGVERKSVRASVRKLIEDRREVLDRVPDAQVWGDVAKIFARSKKVFQCRDDFGPSELQALRETLQDALRDPKQAKVWEKWLAAIGSHSPGKPLDGDLMEFLGKLLKEKEGLDGGSAGLMVARQRRDLTPETCRLLALWLRCFLRDEFSVRVERTRGMHGLLKSFDETYDRVVRAAGLLSFQDVPLRLAGNHAAASGRRGGGDLEYRLDGGFDHWLIDEFQDTSTLQWAAMSGLADEVLQTADGSRSFFYVGDVKQSIYGWRQGDSRLFHLLQEHYRSIQAGQPLAVSWRSSQTILDAVNRVFDPKQLKSFDQLPAGVASRWQKDWTPHKAAPAIRDLSGYVTFQELPREDYEENVLRVLADRVAALPSNGSVTRAVLVRGNEFGQAVEEALRARGIRAVREGTRALADNPMVEGFLALTRFTGHPGDRFARVSLEMSAFGRWRRDAEMSVERLARETLRICADEGLPALVRTWRARLSPSGAGEFPERRWDGLLDAARSFEAEGGGGLDAFEAWVRSIEVGDTPDPDAVRILTIHKAKGLEFDAVFLPELDDRSFTSCGVLGLEVHTAEDIGRTVEWVLDFPIRSVAETDPNLKEHMEARDAEHAYEALCLLYVAMTRARRCLVLIGKEPPEKSEALKSGVLVRAALSKGDQHVTLDGIGATLRYEAGDPDWSCGLQPAVVSPAVQPAPPAGLPAPGVRLKRRMPSASEHGAQPAAWIFTGGASGKFGTDLHALFELVEWSGAGAEDAAISAWRDGIGSRAGASGAVETEFRNAMAAPAFREALARPPGPAELWRERRFEMADGDRWISGCFDRVVIHRDAGGRAVSAEVLDYKSNDVRTGPETDEAAESYRSQMDLYRRCLSRMLDLPAERILARLLFTKPARVLCLPCVPA